MAAEDGPLVSLRLCDAPIDEVRERAWEVFAEALGSSQEALVEEMQQKVAAKDAEVARLGKQLSVMVAEARNGTDAAGVRLAAAQEELQRARSRLAELEPFYRAASTRQAALEERARTLEEETIHWRQRCAPLRERWCATLLDLDTAASVWSRRESARAYAGVCVRAQRGARGRDGCAACGAGLGA